MISSVQWLDWEAPKHFPKPTCTQKRSWSLFGCLLPIWSTTAFWILVKPLQLRSTLSKSTRCTKNSKPAAGTGQHKGPNSSPWQCLIAHHTTNASNAEWTGLQSLASSVIFTLPPTNPLPLLQVSQLFAGKTLPQPAGGTKSFPRVHRTPKHGFLRYRNKQTYFFLIGKTVWLQWFLFWLIKMYLSLVIMI